MHTNKHVNNLFLKTFTYFNWILFTGPSWSHACIVVLMSTEPQSKNSIFRTSFDGLVL